MRPSFSPPLPSSLQGRPRPQPIPMGAVPAPANAAAIPELDSPTVDEPTGAPAVPLGFWQHPFVLNILPFLTSLTAHLAIIFVGWMTYQVVVKVADKVHVQVLIPESVIAPD